MKDLTGKTWNEITIEVQEELLKIANPVSGIDGTTVEEGECIVDFKNCDFSIVGSVVDNEIVINKDSKFYNPIA